MPPTRTHIHAFALDGSSTRYLASGDIGGTIKDRWSLDERDGHLRVAVAWPDRGGAARENGVVVLDERGDRLETVGELRGLGVDEQIQSVRWFDDLAVVVTFRQTDPLYTIDLTDPTSPRRLGELKIPGFSAYLHPIGDDRLLGLGTDATPDGLTLGAQAAVFDIRDRSRARQVDKVTFGDSSLGASEDPHAFTWLPAADAAITTLQSSGEWNRAQSRAWSRMWSRATVPRWSCCGSPRPASCPPRRCPRPVVGSSERCRSPTAGSPSPDQHASTSCRRRSSLP